MARKKTNDIKIKELAAKGLTEREIAALTNTSKTTVHARLQAVKNSAEFRQFTDDKASILEALQYEIINSVDHEAIKTMISKRGLTDAAILQDKIQVLRGQASEVTGVQIRVILDNLPAPAIDVTPQGSNAITADNTTSSVLDICNIDNIRSIRDK
jgi:transposase